MNIAILTIGDELLNGDLADTNTALIARILGGQSFPVREAATVGDQEDDIATALLRFSGRHEAVIVTGGLGPTDDDRTARAAARAFNRPLSLNNQALQQIRERFRAWNRTMHPRNEKQALLPGRATVIPNETGTAPGFHMRSGETDFFFLPGVQSEMRAMLDGSVVPALMARFTDPPVKMQRLLTIFGLAEADVENRILRAGLPDGVTLAFAVEFPFVQVKLRATGDDAMTRLNRAELALLKILDDYIVGYGEETLAETTSRYLSASGLTLALAESCTGGLIATLLTDQPGASAFLERGIVSYANTAKTDCLNVPEEILQRHGAVSKECALAMATGVKKAAQTDIGLAVTGIAGPEGGSAEKPVGTVYLAMVGPTGDKVERFHFHGSREQVRRRSAATALDWLRRLAMAQLADPGSGGTG